jgi:uncharacterized delta-60 repeat protein
MKRKHTAQSGFLTLCILFGLLAFFLGMLLATFAAAHPQPSTRERIREMGNRLHLKGMPVAPAGGVYQKWVARYNGPGNIDDEATAVAVDDSGNVYVTGFSYDANTDYDYTTIKYNAAGQQQWIARYNGPDNYGDKAAAMAIDPAGNVYVTGWSANAGSLDYATIKYNSDGQQQWVARYNGPDNSSEEATAIALDGSGNVYVTGSSWGSKTASDYATVKYDSAGQEQWVVRYDGPASYTDEATALAVDGTGNVYVTGGSYGLGFNYDYATIKYNAAGQQQWVARYDGPINSDDEATGIVLDASGNVYVTGYSAGSAGYDYATINYDTLGQQQWVSRYDGPAHGVDYASAIAIDGSSNVHVTGYSGGSGTDSDYATIRYDAAGHEQWVARYDGPISSADQATAITLDASGNVYVTGNSYGSNGTWDYATVKYDSGGQQQWVSRYNGPGNYGDYANGIAVDGAGNVYVTGASYGSLDISWDYATIKYGTLTPRVAPTPRPRPPTPAPRP